MPIDNLNNLEDDQKIILFALGALNSAPLRSKIKLQKLLFLVSNVFENYGELLEYEPHLFGPYSEIVDSVLEELIVLGLVKQDEHQYELTKKGLEEYLKLKPKEELMNVINDFKEFLNDLYENEILTFVYVSYPEFISESAKWDELKKKRIDVAVSLLRKEKISFGKAIEISGLRMESFENLLKEKGVKWRQ